MDFFEFPLGYLCNDLSKVKFEIKIPRGHVHTSQSSAPPCRSFKALQDLHL